MTTRIEELRAQWKIITNEVMPPTVCYWRYTVIEAALRLWLANIVYWDGSQNRLRLSRKPNGDDNRYWQDIVLCEVYL